VATGVSGASPAGADAGRVALDLVVSGVTGVPAAVLGEVVGDGVPAGVVGSGVAVCGGVVCGVLRCGRGVFHMAAVWTGDGTVQAYAAELPTSTAARVARPTHRYRRRRGAGS